uniref:Uncharacterized protein n=1 Tax=Steinernema glaseri TaxID=37863 RepID=A0A1I7ZSK4_9BILA
MIASIISTTGEPLRSFGDGAAEPRAKNARTKVLKLPTKTRFFDLRREREFAVEMPRWFRAAADVTGRVVGSWSLMVTNFRQGVGGTGEGEVRAEDRRRYAMAKDTLFAFTCYSVVPCRFIGHDVCGLNSTRAYRDGAQ